MAADAFSRVEKQFRKSGLAFRVGAPRATQWATLEEYYGAYAIAIMQGKALNIENHGFCLQDSDLGFVLFYPLNYIG